MNDSACAQDVLAALPISCSGQTWGAEIYFATDVHAELTEEARDEFEVGELGFWPPGNAFCIFYGPTPASQADEPRMANLGLPIGFLLEEDLAALKSLNGKVDIQVEVA